MTQESTSSRNAQTLGGGLGTRRGSPPCGLSVGGVAARNTVLLAPLSGVTDVPFRRLARRFGAGLVVSEMVASGELLKGDAQSALRAMRDGDGIHVVQLAGRDPVWMHKAAEQLAGAGVDIIDINMGCPAKKVVGGLSGSALMREPDLALRLVDATVAGAKGVPVTLKMRLGWDASSINAPQIAARAEGAGVAMMTVHGRTRADFYEGRADWGAIAAVKAVVRVPVVANGDLTHVHQEAAMRAASGADAVMIGRGACGRPWLPGFVAGATHMSDLAAIGFGDLVAEHYNSMLAHYGMRTGLRHARKHLGWYLDRYRAATGGAACPDRSSVMTGQDPQMILRTLRALFAATSLADIEASAAAVHLTESGDGAAVARQEAA